MRSTMASVCAAVDEAALAPSPLAAWPVSSALSESFMRGAVRVAEPLLRHEGRAEAAPLGDRQRARRRAVDHDRCRLRRQRARPTARRTARPGRCRRRPAMPTISPAAHLERDAVEPHAVRIVRASSVRSRTTSRGIAALLRPAAARTSPMSAPTIMRASDAAVSRARVAGRDLLAAAQDGGGVAQRASPLRACGEM